jgi:hypothetical protein
MINSVTAPSTPAATDSAPAAGTTTTLYHTPFGDVMLQTIDGSETGGGRPAVAPVVVHTPAVAAAAPAAVHATPSLQSEFGDQPYLDKPTGTGLLGSYDYNPIYFATRPTADKVAKLLGGTVVEKNTMVTGGPFTQSAPNEMIQFADGREVNAGVIANIFSHGYSQSYIDTLLKQVADGTAV